MPEHSDEFAQEIERLSREWMTAVVERDEETLERFLSEEYRLASGLGMFVDRALWLRMALETAKFEAYEYKDVTVRRYGEVAIMQSHWTQRATLNGAPWNGSGLLTDVWVWRDGRWQVLTRHSSLKAE